MIHFCLSARALHAYGAIVMTDINTEYSRSCKGRVMRGAVCSVVALAVVAMSGIPTASAVRGVAPADQELFANGGVKCAVGGVERMLATDHINDDYCDCDDGTDEPGTSACSHLMQSVFYCDNGGFFSKRIHTSLLNDGICDCCDGSDEFDGGLACSDTCAADAVTYREKAQARLADVEAGFKKRDELLKTVVAAHFNDAKQNGALTEKTLASLAQLKERVEVHKAREERREKAIRLDAARQRLAHEHANEESIAPASTAEAECVPDAESGTTCENPEAKVEEAGETFEEVDALRVTEDEAVAGIEETDPAQADKKDAAVADDSSSQRVATTIQLSDGTTVSLPDYLRMEHSRPSKTFKGPARTTDQKRREDFLGPLFNGNEEDRKRIGLYALRTVGIVASPVRLVAEAVLFLPRLLGDVLSSSVIVAPYIAQLPSIPSVVQSPTFRRLADGQVYRWYNNIAWGGRVVWDAPIVAYKYLFPVLDLELTLPEAESLRKVLKEIDDDIEKLLKDRDSQEADLAFDYGPDQAFYALKDECIEKKVEKYVYKLCAFKEVKQDYTNLGSWEGFGKRESADGDKESLDYNVLNFTKGQRCWNGPERSVKVKLECGAENEILSVDEPSTCVYEMKAQSYVACTREVLEQAKQDVAFWTKK